MLRIDPRGGAAQAEHAAERRRRSRCRRSRRSGRPSRRKLTKLVRGELDWIVMKALEKDRNRRYETANGLAPRHQRYLDDEPVQACPPSAWYRFRKFARRNRTVLATASVVAASLVAVAVLAVLYADRQRHFGLEQAEATRKITALAGDLKERESSDPGRIEPPPGDPQLRPRPGRLREGRDRPGHALDDRELAVGRRRRRSRLAARRAGQPGRLAAALPPAQGGPLAYEARHGRGIQPR